MNKKVGVVFDTRYYDHKIDLNTPENPLRLRGLESILETPKYKQQIARIAPREATTAELLTVHSKLYIDQIREHCLKDDPYSYDKDTYLMVDSLYTAQLAAGGCFAMADTIMSSEIDYGFALVRPPGHHAEAGRGMGFCIVNNIALTAQYLLDVHKLERIMIVDFDVHHGNGTQEIFYETDKVLTFSIHQNNIFPFSGTISEQGQGQGKGYNINVPVPPQFGDQEFTFLVGKMVGCLAEQYLPQIILVSAGYDGHITDPISRTDLTTAWYNKVTEMLKFFAANYADNRLLFVLEGGYAPAALHESILTSLDAMMGPKIAMPGIIHAERAIEIMRSCDSLSHWTFL